MLIIFLIVLLCASVAAAHATNLLGSGIVAPGLLNAGILAPGLLNSAVVAPGLLNSGIIAPGFLNSGILAPELLNSGIVVPGQAIKGAPLLSTIPSSVATSSIVATPGAITSDKRVIGTTGLLVGAPLAYSNSILANGLIGGPSPVLLNRGIVSPLGIRSGGILAGPGRVKTILK